MKITFNEIEKSIEINDGLRKQNLIIKISLIFILINSIFIIVFDLDKKQFEWVGFIWILAGLAFIIMLSYQILKKTSTPKVKLSDINVLTETQFLGRKSLSLKLKNGKVRDLIEMKNASDIIEAKKLFKSIGIQTNFIL